MNDGSRNSLPDKVSELSVPETGFDRQSHTHHMMTGQTAQTNQIPKFLTPFSTTQAIITPTSEPVNTSITRQQFDYG